MNTKPNDDSERVREEAALWVAKLNSGEVSEAERRQFRLWIRQSGAHRDAFFEMRHLLDAVGNASAVQYPPQRKRALVDRPLVVAAGLVFLIGAAVAWTRYDVQYYWQADHFTTVGHQQTLTLADGSRVYLNTASAISVSFDDSQRLVELLQGEAEFVVAHDSVRPFTIVAGEHTVSALGTDFSVRRADDHLIVTVFENAVEIKRRQESIAVVDQGRMWQLPNGSPAATPAAADLEETRAWREGRLVFTAKPLQHVINEINRYRYDKILLLAPTEDLQPVSGVFSIQDLNDALSVIADTLSLNIFRINGLLTVLY